MLGPMRRNILTIALGIMFLFCGLHPVAEKHLSNAFIIDTPERTEGENDIRGIYDIVINEFLPKPNRDWDESGGVDQTGDEWIELYNKGNQPVELSSMRLDDGIFGGSAEYYIPADTRIEPREVMIFFGSTTGIELDNGGDTINLVNWNDDVINSYTYSQSSTDISFGRVPDGSNVWEEISTPTPGGKNTPEPLDRITEMVPGRSYAKAATYLIDSADYYVYLLQNDMTRYSGQPDYPISALYGSLIDAERRGVIVKIILEDSSEENNDTGIYLQNKNIGVRTDENDTVLKGGFLVSDDRVLMGSTAWNHTSMEESSEMNLKMNYTPFGDFFKDYFEALWEEPDKNPDITPVSNEKLETVVDDEYFDKAKSLIEGAGDRIDVMMYHTSLGTKPLSLVQELIDAHGWGVRVRVIMEGGNHSRSVNEDNMAVAQMLRNEGIPVSFDDKEDIMHTNLLRVDSQMLLGSTCWTQASIMENYNTNILVKNGTLVNSTEAHFDEIWLEHGPTTGAISVSEGTGLFGRGFYKGYDIDVTVEDRDGNQDPDMVEEIEVDILSDSDLGGITIDLAETGTDTGIFTGTFTLFDSSGGGDRIKVIGDDNVTIIYNDRSDSAGTEREISTSFMVKAVPGTIELLSPRDGSVFLTDQCKLRWKLLYLGIGEVHYKILLDTVPHPVKVAVENTALESYDLSNLEDEVTYYWKVVPVVDSIERDWGSVVWNFTVELPGVITQISPSNGSSIDQTEVLLQWNIEYAGTADLKFRLLLDTVHPPVTLEAYNLSINSFTVGGLVDGNTYHWRIVPVVNGMVRNWSSATFHFYIEFSGAISLLEPLDGVTVHNRSMRVKWTSDYNGSGKLQYKVLMDKVSSVHTEISNIISGTSFELTFVVEDDTTYYWKVVPVIEGVEKDWCSSVWSFKVEYKGTITLSAPSNGGIIVTNSFKLKWDMNYLGINPVTFKVLLDTNENPVTQLNETTSEEEIMASGLEEGTTYYWQVIPLFGNEEQDWESEIWNFTVEIPEDIGSKGGGGKGSGSGGTSLALIAAVIAVVVVGGSVAVFLLLRKKGKKKGRKKKSAPHHREMDGAGIHQAQQQVQPQSPPGADDQMNRIVQQLTVLQQQQTAIQNQLSQTADPAQQQALQQQYQMVQQQAASLQQEAEGLKQQMAALQQEPAVAAPEQSSQAQLPAQPQAQIAQQYQALQQQAVAVQNQLRQTTDPGQQQALAQHLLAIQQQIEAYQQQLQQNPSTQSPSPQQVPPSQNASPQQAVPAQQVPQQPSAGQQPAGQRMPPSPPPSL